MAVASKKDKLIEEAQKLALRGQFDKAVKLYEQVMTMEPAAINLRQKLAETMIKAGRIDDARNEFETIGKYFSKNGFYLKAIAVYKQLQKLSPSEFSTTLTMTLAELNEKLGLTANALSEYKLVFVHFDKSGLNNEALKILDKMQTVDPANIAIKIKLAEAYVNSGNKDDSYALFSKIAATLQERGDNTTLGRITARIQQLFPDKTDFVLDALADLVKNGNTKNAVKALQVFLRNNTNNKRVWDLIIDAYRKLDQPQRIRIAYQHYLKYFPEDPTPIIGLITCCTEDGDIASAMELLDHYESSLNSAETMVDLENIYRALHAIDPVNIKILEVLVKLTKATGNTHDLENFSSRLESLRTVPGAKRLDAQVSNHKNSAHSDETVFPLSAEASETLLTEIDQLEAHDFGENLLEEKEQAAAEAEGSDTESETSPPCDEDIEIEIDFDIDINSDFEIEKGQTCEEGPDSKWLDSIGGMFEAIATSPSGVRFSSEMDNSDAQSHFDLGLAFKEMGLYDEAINEFRKASADSARRLSCLIMQGACLRERGEYDTAANMLNALLKPGLSQEDSIAVKHELMLTYELAGKIDQAAQLQSELESASTALRDVSSVLNDTNLDNCLDFSDEDLKDFDL